MSLDESIPFVQFPQHSHAKHDSHTVRHGFVAVKAAKNRWTLDLTVTCNFLLVTLFEGHLAQKKVTQ